MPYVGPYGALYIRSMQTSLSHASWAMMRIASICCWISLAISWLSRYIGSNMALNPLSYQTILRRMFQTVNVHCVFVGDSKYQTSSDGGWNKLCEWHRLCVRVVCSI